MPTASVLLIIAHDGYQPVEYGEPKQILKDAGYKVVTASDKAGNATDKNGGTTQVDLTLTQVNPKDYVGIFFIGGPGALEHLDVPASHAIIKKAIEHHIPLGAICIATRILAKANALTRKRATGWNGDNQLESLYATFDVIYLNEPVVVQDNIITAVGPSAAKTFGQEIVALLDSNKGWG